MIVFWLICAGLVAIALAFVLPPLLQDAGTDQADDGKQEANVDVYRDQLSELEADLQNGIISAEQYQQDRDEVERRLLDDVAPTDKPAAENTKTSVDARGPAYAIALAIPTVAVALYLLVGNSGALSGSPTASQQPPFAGSNNPSASGQMSQQGIEANVAALAKRLEQNPNDGEGWSMLGRSYINLEKYSDASNAYAKAAALRPTDVDLLGDYAFALAMANGRKLEGQPLEIIKRALQLDPNNAKALELSASAEFQTKNYKQAIANWEKVLAMTPPGSELAQTLLQRINEAKALDGQAAK